MTYQTAGMLIIALAIVSAALMIADEAVFIWPAIALAVGLGMCLVKDMTTVDRNDIE